MQTTVVREEPVFTIVGANGWDGGRKIVSVSWSDLRNAHVGTRWEAHDPTNCVRASRSEEAEVVYRSREGVAVLFRKLGTTDSPEPEPLESVELVWFDFAPPLPQA